MKEWNPDPSKVTRGVVGPFMTVFSAIDRYGITKAKQGRWSFAVSFFLVGNAIPYLLGDRHDPSVQICSAVFFSIIGACLAWYLNRGRDKRIAKGLPVVNLVEPDVVKPEPRYEFGKAFALIGFCAPFIFVGHQAIDDALALSLMGGIVGACLSFYMNWRDKKKKKLRRAERLKTKM